MKLENWKFVKLQGNTHAQGEVYGNPKHKDGNIVITSAIVMRGDGWIETQNNRYELGKEQEDTK